MMKYYRFMHDFKVQLKGRASTQVFSYWPHRGDYDFYQDDPKCYTRAWLGRIEDDTRFFVYALNKKARWTDFLDSTGLEVTRFLFVSEKLLEIIKAHVPSEDIQIFPSYVTVSDKNYKDTGYLSELGYHEWLHDVKEGRYKVYYILYFPNTYEHLADLSQTNVFEQHVFGKDPIHAEFKTLDETYGYQPKSVKFLKETSSINILRMFKIGGWIYCSERLKEAIEAASCTGIHFEPADWIKVSD